MKRVAIAEKTYMQSRATSRDDGRKKVAKTANNLMSPAPTLNLNKMGERAIVTRALVG